METCPYCGGAAHLGSCPTAPPVRFDAPSPYLAPTPDAPPPLPPSAPPEPEPAPAPAAPAVAPAAAPTATPPAAGPPAAPAQALPPPGWFNVNGTATYWNGQAWLTGAPTSRRPFRSLQLPQLFFWCGAGLWTLATLWLVYSLYDIHSLLGDLQLRPNSVTQRQVLDADDAVTTAERLQNLAWIVAGVPFLIWLYRAMQNLHERFAFRHLEHSALAAIGWWFCPIANLWKPWSVVREAWTISPQIDAQAQPRQTRPTPALGVWWGLFLAGGVTWRIATGLSHSAETIGSVRSAYLVGIGAQFILLLALATLISIVLGITQRQEAADTRLS